MLHFLIKWALNNPLIVILSALALGGAGVYSFSRINVEAYPDPAPAIIEIDTLYPGASAAEVERQVTVPMEVTMAGLPNLTYIRTKSLFGLSFMRLQFEYGYEYEKARQEVINRLASQLQPLPPGVTPQISPESPTGEIYRYTLNCPKDGEGRDIYALNDLKALQDWVLEREFRRVHRIIDVTSYGGTIKRYEIHPDYNQLKLFGVTLPQLQTALQNANQNAGADVVVQGDVAMPVRSIGLIGGGEDPVNEVLGMEDPDSEAAKALQGAKEAGRPDVEQLKELQRRRLATAAAAKLREAENRRIVEIRSIVVASVNNRDILVEDLVEGGRLGDGDRPGERGVVVGHQTRLGKIQMSKPQQMATPTGIRRVMDGSGKLVWRDEQDVVSCIVLLHKGDDSLPALKDVEKKVAELNDPNTGKMLPGVFIESYYDRTDLINITTDTVKENLFIGMTLVSVILLMFLSNVRSAIIVAINIPLALLFAFTTLYLRGRSANLLSIGAVDFGIIVDSSVIIVENIYRHLSSGEHITLSLKERILRACREVEKPLLFSSLIMVCAFIPLFTMQGPEGQIFGPMADTYAFALGGALLLAVFLAPVLCLLFYRRLRPVEDNFFVRWLRNGYLRQLDRVLRYRWVSLGVFTGLIVFTAVYAVPRLGREFMPELEEGNLWVRGTFPLQISLDATTRDSAVARKIMATYPEVETAVNQLGRPDDGTDSDGYYNSEFFVPLRPQKDWPAVVQEKGWFGQKRMRPRTKTELVDEMSAEMTRRIPGASWNFSQNIRDNVMEAMSGVKGDNSVKIFGPKLEELDRLAELMKDRLRSVRGIEDVGVFSIKGATNLEFLVDKEKCKKWGVSAADVNNVISTALGGKAFSTMIEGEKSFDISVRLPLDRRASEKSILDIPVDITNNQVVLNTGPALNPNPLGGGYGPPNKTGSSTDTSNPIANNPRLKLRDLVSPVGKDGRPDPNGSFERAGPSTIYREQGQRQVAIKFSVRDRDLASAVDEAKAASNDLFHAPYRTVWSGEFQEEEEAEARLMFIVPASLGLIFLLLYLAFRSFLDALLVLANVIALSLGGVWALLLTHTNFSISAAVGFISIFGVAIMDGLLLVSYFNAMRAQGLPLREAILEGAAKRVRPVMMTALTAIFGLLPAALSTKIGAQTQRPLAIVVVGGMITTLFLTRYLMPLLYSFYGHRQPPAGAGGMAH
jgi:cobalt-zinc-cadmium resistance protein CzcA